MNKISIGFVAMIAVVGGVIAGEDRTKPGVELRIAPVVTVDIAVEASVAIVVQNISESTYRYMGIEKRLPFRYTPYLRQGGKIVVSPTKVMYHLDKKYVRELKKDAILEVNLDLREEFGNIEPGRYEFWMALQGAPPGFGLDPLRYHQFVCFLEIKH